MNTVRALLRWQVEEIREELEAERDRLERAIARDEAASAAPGGTGFVAAAPGSPSSTDHDVSVMSQTQARHEAVVDALRRLEEGSYGACTACQNPIPYGRLAVMPETRYCVGCGARV